jgi:hypothetical protein
MTMAEIAKRVGYVSRNGTFSQMVSAWKADRHNEAGDQITLPLDDPRWSREWWRTPTPRTNGLNGHGSTRVKQLHHQQDLDALVNENATLYSRIAELESELAALR